MLCYTLLQVDGLLHPGGELGFFWAGWIGGLETPVNAVVGGRALVARWRSISAKLGDVVHCCIVLTPAHVPVDAGNPELGCPTQLTMPAHDCHRCRWRRCFS